MSLSRKRYADEGGFTLIEVVVALGILAVVSTAIVAQVIVGLRAAATARDVSQSKGVAQARLEAMRNMPFFVGRSAGDYIDVLDTYYRHTTAPATAATCTSGSGLGMPQTSWSGYVPAATARCSYEPSGPMFRKVINPIAAPGLGTFAMVVNTQFLTATTPPAPVAPQAGYNSQVAGSDTPASNQIGVTVTVVYKTQSGFKSSSTYTQIGQRSPIDPLIQTSVNVSTVRVGSVYGLVTPANARLDVGVVNLVGELSTGSKVSANATAGSAGTSLGQSAVGASVNASAPADEPAQSAVAGPDGLFGDCSLACIGNSQVSGVSAQSSNGLPLAGAPGTPISASVPSGTTLRGFQFDNGASGNRLRLDGTQPMVSLDTSSAPATDTVANCAFTGTGAPNYLTATGFLDATKDTGSDYVRACGTAQGGTIKVLPTTFAPDGIVQVDLFRASVDCRVNTAGSNHAAATSIDYKAKVRYWNGGGYSTVPLVDKSNGSDPLTTVDLNQSIGPGGLRLSDYITSWRSLAPGDVTVKATGSQSEAFLPGVVSIDTQPTREGVSGGVGPYSADAASGLSVQIGALSCKAKDVR